MVDPKKKASCKFYNFGFCKFQDRCRFEHFKTNCNKYACKDKKCFKRHPKKCRYQEKCRRKSCCLYKHDDVKPNIKVEEEIVNVRIQSDKYLEDLQSLKEDVKILKSRIVGQKTMLDSAEHEIENSEKLKIEIINSFVNQHKTESELKDKMISNLNEKLKTNSNVQECKRCKEMVNIQQDFTQLHGDFSKLKIIAKQLLDENTQLKKHKQLNTNSDQVSS